MSVSFPSAFPTPSTAKSSSLTAKPAETKSPEEKFLEYAKMTPADRMHAAMLAQLGITEDQFKAKDSAAQQKIEEKIRETVRQQAENVGYRQIGLRGDGLRPAGLSSLALIAAIPAARPSSEIRRQPHL